jgi:hypothetical protein
MILHLGMEQNGEKRNETEWRGERNSERSDGVNARKPVSGAEVGGK